MNLKGRIPVEQLDDERWTNIERAVVSGAQVTPARAPRFKFALALGVAMIVAIGAGFAGWMVRGPGAKPQPMPVAVAEPVRVHTTAEHSTLDIGDATIESDPSTEFAVTRPDGGVLVTMKRGKVLLQVGKRGSRPPLVVAAGDTRVIVIGTRFSVDYGDGSGPVEVRVFEGVVRVENAQEEVKVAANQGWQSGTKHGVVAIAELPAKAKQVAVTEMPPDHIEIDTSSPDVLHERDSAVPEAKLSTNPKVEVVKKPVGPELKVRPQSNDGAGSASLDLHALVLAQPLLPPLDLGLRPEESVSKYREIGAKTGEEGSMAWYSIAYMQSMKLGRTGDALQTLDLYQRRFEGGKESHSWASFKAALWLRVRISCSKAVDERCRQAAYTYMHEAHDTPAAKVAEALTLTAR